MRKLAETYLALSEAQLRKAVEAGIILEVFCHEQDPEDGA